MMLGIIADAHGNIYGLKRCIFLLEELDVENIFFLGDAINYFGRTREVLDLLKYKKVKCIRGNHEELLLKEKKLSLEIKKLYNIDFTKMSLKKEDYMDIASWGDSIELKVGNCKILMVHASPFNYFEEYIYPNDDFTKFLEVEYDLVFMGHTHIPFVRHIDDKVIVNVGSVGFSREDGRFINCVVFDAMRRKVKILKDKFPVEAINNLKPFHRDMYKVLERRITKQGRINETQ